MIQQWICFFILTKLNINILSFNPFLMNINVIKEY